MINRLRKGLHQSFKFPILGRDCEFFIPNEEFRERRKNLVSRMPDNSLVLLNSGDMKYMSQNIYYRFRQESNFYYLCGFTEPNSKLLIHKDETGEENTILFVDIGSSFEDKWEGSRYGILGVKNELGLENVKDIKQFEDHFLQQVGEVEHLFSEHTMSVGLPLFDASIAVDAHTQALLTHVNRHSYIPNMEKIRGVKSMAEIQLIQSAVDITDSALAAVVGRLRPGMKEVEVETIIEYEFKMGGAQRPSFLPVVAGDTRGNILHYTMNNNLLSDPNSLVLIDCGCEYQMYSSDISRTYPVNGKFSPEQKDVYETVLTANEECFKAVKNGMSMCELHELSESIMSHELYFRGICGNRSQNEIKKSIGCIYPHSVSHFLGIDIHEEIEYLKPLENGNVFSIEPGLYMDPRVPLKGLLGVEEKYHGIAVRIEDDIAMIDNKAVNLSQAIPKSISEIERLMENAKQNHQ